MISMEIRLSLSSYHIIVYFLQNADPTFYKSLSKNPNADPYAYHISYIDTYSKYESLETIISI